ncbi:phosphoribosyltransferase [Aureococcus anophagefferens]|nr:phosphoribosyltransferase [Aureococcus anophagefferens]
MDDDALAAALRAGRGRADRPRRGAVCVAVGEVGIGNTTAAAALLAALTGEDAAVCCGRGTGLDDQGLAHKVDTAATLAFHGAGLAPREALRRLGGFEIAAMVGAYAAARAAGVVTLVDGSISAVAALCAEDVPEAATACSSAALAEEPGAAAGGAILARELAAKPALDMALRLGEASGAVLALPLARSAAALLGAGTLAAPRP